MDSKLLELCRLPVGYPPYMVASIASIGHYSAGSKTAFAAETRCANVQSVDEEPIHCGTHFGSSMVVWPGQNPILPALYSGPRIVSSMHHCGGQQMRGIPAGDRITRERTRMRKSVPSVSSVLRSRIVASRGGCDISERYGPHVVARVSVPVDKIHLQKSIP